MTSLNEPVSGFFKYNCPPVNRGGSCWTTALTTNDAGTTALDNKVFGRASKLAPLFTPPNITYSDVDPVIMQYNQSKIENMPSFGVSPWHFITNPCWSMQNATWYEMHDSQTGQTEKIFIGDTITVIYPNGYSEKWQFKRGHRSDQWERVPNTLMHNGKPVNPPSTSSATPAPGAGSAGGTDPYNSPGSSLGLWADRLTCYGTSSVTLVLDNGTNLTSYGFFPYPC